MKKFINGRWVEDNRLEPEKLDGDVIDVQRIFFLLWWIVKWTFIGIYFILKWIFIGIYFILKWIFTGIHKLIKGRNKVSKPSGEA